MEISKELVKLVVGVELATYESVRDLLEDPLKKVDKSFEEVFEVRMKLTEINPAIVVLVDVTEHSVNKLFSKRDVQFDFFEEVDEEQPQFLPV